MLEKIKQILNIRKKTLKVNVFEKINKLFDSLGTDVLQIEIGSDIISFGEFICKITDNIREEMKDELGFIMPPVHIIDNLALQENEFVIKIRDKIMYDGFVVPNQESIVSDIYENLKSILISNFSQVLTNELTEKYIESVRINNSLLVWDITGAISTSEIRIILSDLLERGKSIKDISGIFEKISEQIFIENKYNYRNPHKVAEEIIKQIK